MSITGKTDDLTIARITEKTYECTRCGHQGKQSTNHYGETWSWGRVNVCPACPPYKKSPEYGGSTRWKCVDTPPSK